MSVSVSVVWECSVLAKHSHVWPLLRKPVCCPHNGRMNRHATLGNEILDPMELPDLRSRNVRIWRLPSYKDGSSVLRSPISFAEIEFGAGKQFDSQADAP